MYWAALCLQIPQELQYGFGGRESVHPLAVAGQSSSQGWSEDHPGLSGKALPYSWILQDVALIVSMASSAVAKPLPTTRLMSSWTTRDALFIPGGRSFRLQTGDEMSSEVFGSCTLWRFLTFWVESNSLSRIWQWSSLNEVPSTISSLHSGSKVYYNLAVTSECISVDSTKTWNKLS